MKLFKYLFLSLLVGALSLPAIAQDIRLASSKLKVEWREAKDGWHISSLQVGGRAVDEAAGYYTLIYYNGKPRPELVQQNQEGVASSFYPAQATVKGPGHLQFRQELAAANIIADWVTDPDFPTDIRVELHVTVKRDGY